MCYRSLHLVSIYVGRGSCEYRFGSYNYNDVRATSRGVRQDGNEAVNVTAGGVLRVEKQRSNTNEHKI